MTKILIVEDEAPILMGLKDSLELEGFQVAVANNGREGYEKARKTNFDIILLDIMLPEMNGFEICKNLRTQGHTNHIIMLTAKIEESDKVVGLNIGADDYITKPFSILELIARLKSVERRLKQEGQEKEKFIFREIEVDFNKFEIKKRGVLIDFSAKEIEILRYFLHNIGDVVSRNELLNKVWGYDVFPSTRTVDNHIVKLRQKLEDDPENPELILSIRGVGYKFNLDADEIS
ncbi:MAG: response regulator transcription factor [bacterium]